MQAFQAIACTARQLLEPEPFVDINKVLKQLHVPAAVPRAAISALVKRQQQVWLLVNLTCYLAHVCYAQAHDAQQAADKAVHLCRICRQLTRPLPMRMGQVTVCCTLWSWFSSHSHWCRFGWRWAPQHLETTTSSDGYCHGGPSMLSCLTCNLGQLLMMEDAAETPRPHHHCQAAVGGKSLC